MSERAPSDELLRTILARLPDLVVKLDRRGRASFLNRDAKAIPPRQVHGGCAIDFVDSAYRGAMRRALARVFRKGRSAEVEVLGVDDFRAQRWYRVRLEPVVWRRKVEEAIAYFADITSLKSAQEDLARSRESYRLLFHASPIPMWLVDRKTLRFVEVNDAALRQLGYARSEFLGKSAGDIRPRSELPRLRRAARSWARGLPPPRGIWTYRRKDGSLFEAEVSTQRMTIDGRDSVLIIAQDVTERRRAEKVLAESRESYRLIFEANPNPMVVADRATSRWLAVNEAAIRHYGYSREQWLKMTAGDIHPPQERERLKRYRIGRGLVSHGVWKQRKKDGTIIDVDITTNSLRFQGRDAIMGTFRDVTSERAALEAFRRSQESYRLLFDRHPNPMMVWDRKTFRYIAVNDAAVRLYGYSREEWLRKTVFDIRPASERARLRRYLRALRPGLAGHGVWKHVTKSGAAIEVDVSGQPVLFQGRDAFLQSVRDITARRRAEEGLRQAQEFDRIRFEASPLPMWVTDRDTLRFDGVNDAALKLFGYSRDQFLNLRLPDIRLATDIPGMLRRIKAFPPGIHARGVQRFRRKDGAVIELDLFLHAMELHGRSIFLAIARDATRERQLQALEHQFSEMFQSSRDGLNFVDMTGRIKQVNDAFCRLLGYRREELVGKRTFLTLTPPEFHKLNMDAQKRLLDTGEPVEYEKEYFRKDGTRVPVSLRSFLLRDADGQPVGTAAIVRDISERKRLEREILEIGAREQSRIGRELHDSLGQYLTGISFLAKSLKVRLAGQSAAETRAAERIAQAASDAVEQVKALAAGLVPAELLSNGLPAALRALCAQAEKTLGLDCALSCPKPVAGMEDASLLHLYRIAQEAVNNAAKHADARTVRVHLREADGRVILQVVDDGKGIRRGKHRGLGLKIMEHRARMLGGAFEVKRRPGGGTVVVCSSPVGGAPAR